MLQPFQKRGGPSDYYKEEETVDVIEGVAGLIKIFKRKIWMLPSVHAIKSYHILLHCLEYHYSDPLVLQNVPKVRQMVSSKNFSSTFFQH